MIPESYATRLTKLHELRVRIDVEIRNLESELRHVQRRKNAGARTTRRQWIEHGTNAGYQWHLRHGLPFEGPFDCGCREAHAAYVAVATRRRKAQRRLAGVA